MAGKDENIRIDFISIVLCQSSEENVLDLIMILEKFALNFNSCIFITDFYYAWMLLLTWRRLRSNLLI